MSKVSKKSVFALEIFYQTISIGFYFSLKIVQNFKLKVSFFAYCIF